MPEKAPKVLFLVLSLVCALNSCISCNAFQPLIPIKTYKDSQYCSLSLGAQASEIAAPSDTVTTMEPPKGKNEVKKTNKNTKKMTSKKKTKTNGKSNNVTLGIKKYPKEKGKKKKKSTKSYKARRPLKELKLGAYIDGTVVDIKEYGAFVQTRYQVKDKGWALLHKSQIQHNYVGDINKILKVGQKVKPRVISINANTTEVALSLRPQRAPRVSLNDISVGDAFNGTVKSIASYGAFVDIGCKSDALLHISRISIDKIAHITDYINVGDKVAVHVISVDKTKKTLAASMLPEIADEYLDRRKKYQERLIQTYASLPKD